MPKFYTEVRYKNGSSAIFPKIEAIDIEQATQFALYEDTLDGRRLREVQSLEVKELPDAN